MVFSEGFVYGCSYHLQQYEPRLSLTTSSANYWSNLPLLLVLRHISLELGATVFAIRVAVKLDF